MLCFTRHMNLQLSRLLGWPGMAFGPEPPSQGVSCGHFSENGPDDSVCTHARADAGARVSLYRAQMVALASALQTAGFTQVELRDGAPAGPQFVSSRIVAKKF